MSKQIALVVGASGIVGLNLATHLAGQDEWTVYGLARRPSRLEGVRPVVADLLRPETLRGALEGLQPTHVFITTWQRQPSEAENIKVQGAECAGCANEHQFGPTRRTGHGIEALPWAF